MSLWYIIKSRIVRKDDCPLGRTLSERAQRLNELQSRLDAIDDFKEKDRVFFQLPKYTQDKLELLWKQLYTDRGRKNIPVSGGKWSNPKEPGNSMWIPEDMLIPPNKDYNNLYNKTWKQIKEENNIKGGLFVDGRVDFTPIAIHQVQFDWEEALGYEGVKYLVKTGDRQYIHMYAFSLLAKQLNKSLEEVMHLKEADNLVWHEEPDCKTLRLVVREVHDNIKHFGGKAMAAIVFDEK